MLPGRAVTVARLLSSEDSVSATGVPRKVHTNSIRLYYALVDCKIWSDCLISCQAVSETQQILRNHADLNGPAILINFYHKILPVWIGSVLLDFKSETPGLRGYRL
jgi:hypothetical protein